MNRGETAQRKEMKRLLVYHCQRGLSPLNPLFETRCIIVTEASKEACEGGIHNWAKTPPYNPRLGVDRVREVLLFILVITLYRFCIYYFSRFKNNLFEITSIIFNRSFPNENKTFFNLSVSCIKLGFQSSCSFVK